MVSWYQIEDTHLEKRRILLENSLAVKLLFRFPVKKYPQKGFFISGSFYMVGATGFEPAIFPTPSERLKPLGHTPKISLFFVGFSHCLNAFSASLNSFPNFNMNPLQIRIFSFFGSRVILTTKLLSYNRYH